VIALIVRTDGRGEYLEQCLPSLDLTAFDARIVVDDSGDAEYGAWVDGLTAWDATVHHESRRGLGACVASGWRTALDLGADFVWDVEEDFVFLEQPDLPLMSKVLARRKHLSQLVFLRQAWSPEEINAGGLIPCAEQRGVRFEPKLTSIGAWVEHRGVFSLNPSLIPRRTMQRLLGAGVEAEFSALLDADPDDRRAYWGYKSEEPRCIHVGERRSAGWAL